MKKIEAFVRPERLDAVRRALAQTGHRSLIHYAVWYRGTEPEINRHQAEVAVPLYEFMPKVRVELVVEDNAVRQVADALSDSAYTGHTGDGKIFVLPVEEAIRIQTKETGDLVL